MSLLFVPKKDLHNLCQSFTNVPDNEELKKKFEEHEKENILSQKSKEQDKSLVDNNFVLLTFDLQAVLPSPTGEVSIFYYKSKINSYNFTICELGMENVECFFWHE
jgi:hypothetical protein